MIFSLLQKLEPIRELVLSDQLLITVPTDLTKPETLPELKIRAVLAVKYARVGPAYQLLKQLQKLLFTQSSEVKKHYEGVLSWLQYVALPVLSESELIDFFKSSNLTFILEDEDYNDLVGALRLRLLSENIEDRDKLREKIYNALHENEYEISLTSASKQQRGTIANWLKQYDSAVGLDPSEAIAVAEFNNQSAIKAKLDGHAKILLRNLLEFYEFIKLSSSDILGFEEDVVVDKSGKTYLLSQGDMFDVSRAGSELKPIVTIHQPGQNAVSAPSARQMPPFQSAASEARRLLSSTQGQVSAVLSALGQALSEQRTTEGLGALLLLAQLRNLDDVLVSDQNLLSLVRDDLKKSGQDDKVEGLRLNPTAPNFIARFLKVALQDKLGLAPEQALGFAQKLAGLLALEGEKYGRIVIEDGQGGWKWNL